MTATVASATRGSLGLESGWHGPRRGADRRAWERVRLLVLERDNWRCQIGIVGRCKGKANTADHIQAVAEGGALLDPANLRAACTPCNAYLGAKLGGQRRQYLRKHSRVW